ncbi:YedE-related selenium metabolism membrane protein [Alkalicella caledoniensis]|uniref:YedE-related selenium metabolism membrane protein n=1 Tax=Alkalicella caledoniensis TaxID=2731377 RepID=A0A7G9W8Y6_ALKCA|nr:YedE family putative selenium transporter [Alkalicella caledoniensis]QNO15148.1 YedE-related selenium metabolism membrane protein [Alkalicella caledoniensis]
MNFFKKQYIIIAGIIIGFLGAFLVKLGNPGNMGVCVACFVRDIAGGVGLHRAGVVQYIRPEVIGFILGSFFISLAFKEFKVRGGSSPLTRFVLGFFVMIGALVFLGCPFRMILRLANGDLNAVVALLGFISGIFIGIKALKGGFTLGRTTEQNISGGFTMPIIVVLLLAFLIVKPDFIFFSLEGPGSFTAPILIALGAGLIVGVFGQRSRFCMAGGIRDSIVIKDFHMLSGYIAVFIVALATNLIFNGNGIDFKLGFEGQPIAHTDHLWNFLGMGLVGLGSVLLGGCPLRQLILTGEGNLDSAVTVLGMVMGAAFAHNFSLAATPAGVGSNGKVAVIMGFIVMAVVIVSHSKYIFVRRGRNATIGR